MNEAAPQREYSLRSVFNALWYLIRVGGDWRLLPNDRLLWNDLSLKWRKWGAQDLAGRAKGDLGKVAIAARVRAETVETVETVVTVVTVAWQAERLQMGTAGYVNNRLYRWRKGMLRKSTKLLSIPRTDPLRPLYKFLH